MGPRWFNLTRQKRIRIGLAVRSSHKPLSLLLSAAPYHLPLALSHQQSSTRNSLLRLRAPPPSSFRDGFSLRQHLRDLLAGGGSERPGLHLSASDTCFFSVSMEDGSLRLLLGFLLVRRWMSRIFFCSFAAFLLLSVSRSAGVAFFFFFSFPRFWNLSTSSIWWPATIFPFLLSNFSAKFLLAPLA